jgi:hypothetical protein
MIRAEDAARFARNWNDFNDVFSEIKNASQKGKYSIVVDVKKEAVKEFQECFKLWGYKLDVIHHPSYLGVKTVQYKINW